MLRYCYLLCLLFKCTFCYDYVSNQESDNRILQSSSDNKNNWRYILKNNHKLASDHDSTLEGYDDDKEPEVMIDVNNFIQKPDYDSIDDSENLEHRNRKSPRKPSSDYNGDYSDFRPYKAKTRDIHRISSKETNGELINKEKPSRRQSDFNAYSFDENTGNLIKSRSSGDSKSKVEYLNEVSLTDSPLKDEKKSSLKSFKIPFFSHNLKAETPKPKKTKKRKLFCFNCKANKAEAEDLRKHDTHQPSTLTPSINEYEKPERPFNMYKIKKRSYEEQLCPECKRKFTKKRRKRNPPFVHNSRQFFARANKLGKGNVPKEFVNNGKVKYLRDVSCSNIREKREDYKQDSERQIQELDAVQKKVDSVQLPDIGKMFAKN